jgi:hypothetical protein
MRLTCYALTPEPPRLVPASSERAWMDQFPQHHPYRCLTLAISNRHGWEILSPASFLISWSGGPEAGDIQFLEQDDYPYLTVATVCAHVPS